MSEPIETTWPTMSDMANPPAIHELFELGEKVGQREQDADFDLAGIGRHAAAVTEDTDKHENR